VTNANIHLNFEPLTKDEYFEAAVVATRGFYTDPFFVFLSHKAELRNRGLVHFFHGALKHMGKDGRIVTVRDETNRIVGVSAWLPTGAYPTPVRSQLAQIPSSFRALFRSRRALLLGNKYIAAIAKAHPKEPHWYLLLLVADPEMQRHGVGRMLMDNAIPQIDEEGVASYLETQKEANIAYYRRYGYELHATLRPVKNGPPLFTMRRAAR
jgi:ribosomal protein S18 acetylase RimI-like enzyme